MTKAEFVQEVIDRGYDYVKPARIGRFVENAYQGICAWRGLPWPFLEKETTGKAPLVIADLRKVLSVKDATNEVNLRGVDRRWLVSAFPNLTDEAQAEYWYLEDDTLKVYPEATDTLATRYVRIPAPLADPDEPLIPAEWQHLIPERAVVDCQKDDDEYTEARALLSEIRDSIEREMVPALFGRNLQNPGFVQRTGRFGDYL